MHMHNQMNPAVRSLGVIMTPRHNDKLTYKSTRQFFTSFFERIEKFKNISNESVKLVKNVTLQTWRTYVKLLAEETRHFGHLTILSEGCYGLNAT